MTRVWARVLLASFAFQAVGCHSYKWVPVKPTEVPKLNGSYVRDRGTVSTPSGAVSVQEVTVAHVERPDGTLVEISGKYDLRVTSQGNSAVFEHPVNSRLQDQFLIVTSGNRAATPYVLRTVERTEVKQPDPTSAFALATALGGTALVIAAVLIIAR